MKIEKISENQIKCTLTKTELEARKLKISELAYGTLKTQQLLRDLMQQAAQEIGFHAENYPLMIEAIPSSGDTLILIVTKVEKKDGSSASDTDFPSEIEDEYLDDMEDIEVDDEDEAEQQREATSLIEMFHQVRDKLDSIANGKDYIPLTDIIAAANKSKADAKLAREEAERNKFRIFSFDNLEILLQAAILLGNCYHGHSQLYKSKELNRYYLIMDKSSHTDSAFNTFCNTMSEFGTPESSTPVSEAYYKEHLQLIIQEDALKKLLLIQED